MSYVPPHARKNNMSNTKTKKMTPENKFEMEFPTLGASVNVKTEPKMNFSNLFKEEEMPPKEIKTEMKHGYIKLTKNGFIDSISEEEHKIEDDKKNIKQINANMIKLFNQIELTKERRMAWDNNYSPEVVIDEYSSSDHYTSEESDDYAEDPEDEFNDI